MANKKFSEFVLKTSTSDVSHIVGYNGAENVQITPANFVTGGGTGVFLPLAGGTMVGNTIHNDNVKSIYGSPGNDLEIYHDSSNSHIRDTGTGNLYIDSSNLFIRVNENENAIIANANSSVALHFNSSEKFATTNTGISVTGGGTFTGDVSVAGSGAKIISASSSNDNSTLFLSGSGSGKDTRIVFGNNRNLLFETSSSSTPTSTGTPVLTLDTSLNATFAGNVGIGGGASYKLQVSGAQNANDIVINNTTTGLNLRLQSNDASANIFSTGALPLTLGTNSTEKMRLDASGNLGLGTSSPTDYFSGADNLVVKQASGNGGISIVTDTSSAGALYFADGTTGDETYRGGVAYEHSSDKLFLVSGGQSKAVIDSSGNLGVGTSSPSNKLGIAVSSNSNTRAINLYSGNNQAGAYTSIGSQFSETNQFVSSEVRFGNETTSGGGSYLGFSTGSSGDGSNSEKMRIDSSGDIDITSGGVIKGMSYLELKNNGGAVPTSTSPRMYSPASGTLGFAMNGSERVRITSAGELLVGTTTSAPSAQLTIALNDSVGGRLSLSNLRTALFDGDEFGRISFVSNDATQTGDRARIAALCRDTAAATDLVFYTGISAGTIAEKMRLTSGGDLLVGTTSTNPTSGVSILDTDAGAYIMTDHLNGTASGTAFAIFRYNQSQIGSITQNGTSAVQFNTSSDYRLKEDLQDFEGLDLISKIPVYDYKWKADDSRSYGVMAHELEEVLPQAVSGEKDAEEMQSVDYSKIVPLLVKSIQELSAKLEALECQCEKK